MSDKDHTIKLILGCLKYEEVEKNSKFIIRHDARANIFILCLNINFYQIGTINTEIEDQ